MDVEQLIKTTQWLDEERRKDKQEIAALQERLSALGAENAALQRKIQQFESDLATSSATLQRLAKIDEILTGYRKEMTRHLEDLEQRRSEGERELERLRKVEREGLNKTLAELRKGAEAALKLDREAQARKEEETRITRVVGEVQQKVTDFSRHLDERMRAVTVVEEGRRQDAKRLTELQTELVDLRKRVDDNRGKLDIVEDLGRRLDVRLGELAMAEGERRALQNQWLEAQSVAQAERDRAWSESMSKLQSSLELVEEFTRRMDKFGESSREMRKATQEFKQMTEFIERRLTETTEMQRLAEERFRQDWAAFLADDQKRWTTHMLLRDEQWREHDRLNGKQLERLELLEEQMSEALGTVQHLRNLDVNRLQTLLNLLRDMLAEHERNFTKVR